MKQKVFSVVALVAVIVFVIVNTIVIDGQIKGVLKDVEELDIEADEAGSVATEMFRDFEKKEAYISLTSNHDDLTNIEDCFVELIGYLSVGDREMARVTKNRLKHSLEHLRRLSTFTINAII